MTNTTKGRPKAITTQIDDNNFDWLTIHAKREGRTKADIIRQLLGEYRRKIEAQTLGTKRETAPINREPLLYDVKKDCRTCLHFDDGFGCELHHFYGGKKLCSDFQPGTAHCWNCENIIGCSELSFPNVCLKWVLSEDFSTLRATK